MKTILNKFLAAGSIALLIMASCKKDEMKVTATSGTAGTLSANSTTLVLAKAKAADTTTVVSFKFSKADYGFNAAVTNTLQIDATADNWASPQSVTLLANTYSQGFSTNDFNSLLLRLNLPTGKASQISARIMYSASSSIKAVYSNVVTLTVTPYALISYIYAPGMMQNTDASLQWQPTTADSLVSATGNGIYTGYLHFSAGDQFKFTPAKSWSASYGDAGSGKISLSSGTNLTAPGAGLYQVTVDLNANTVTYTKFDHLWSVIGDGAQGWNPGNDVDMTFSINANAYQVTTALVKTGSIKFRADHDWALSYGDVSPVNGQLTSSNGGNIAVPANGNYLISLSFGNPIAPTYTLVKK